MFKANEYNRDKLVISVVDHGKGMSKKETNAIRELLSNNVFDIENKEIKGLGLLINK